MFLFIYRTGRLILVATGWFFLKVFKVGWYCEFWWRSNDHACGSIIN